MPCSSGILHGRRVKVRLTRSVFHFLTIVESKSVLRLKNVGHRARTHENIKRVREKKTAEVVYEPVPPNSVPVTAVLEIIAAAVNVFQLMRSGADFRLSLDSEGTDMPLLFTELAPAGRHSPGRLYRWIAACRSRKEKLWLNVIFNDPCVNDR